MLLTQRGGFLPEVVVAVSEDSDLKARHAKMSQPSRSST